MPAKDDHDLLHQLAERLGLDDGETENFVTSSMRRLGHRAQIAWEDATPQDDEEGGGDFFSKKRQQRKVGGSQEEPRRNAGWQYGG
jgi:hypothetical protein